MNTLQSNNQDTSKSAVSVRYASACRSGRSLGRRGFTLIEILVALAIFTLLMGIILVPINMGMDMLHIGKAQSDVRSATQSVVNRMRGDLKHAVYVFPNDVLPSVTGTAATSKLPYEGYAPYYNTNPCSATPANRVSNLSRIDMLLPLHDSGNLVTPITPTYYIVTYYARRRDVSQPVHPIDNPVTLYRAQIPFRGDPSNPTYLIDEDGNAMPPETTGSLYPSNAIGSANTNIYNSRYPSSSACSANSTNINRSSAWLVQSAQGEPKLEHLTNQNYSVAPEDVFTLYGSHVSIIPTDVGLATGRKYNDAPPTGYVPPKSTFVCADTDADGIIDQVTLNVLLEKVDSMGAQPKGQEIMLSQVVLLPNVRSFVNIQ